MAFADKKEEVPALRFALLEASKHRMWKGCVMIDIENGNIQFMNKSLIIRRWLSKDEFLYSDLFADVIKQDDYNYTRFYLKPQLMDNKKFFVALLFNPEGRLSIVSLSLSTDDIIPSWENWSEERELNNKSLNDKWLRKSIGKPPYNYSWGTIDSSYDPRSASSSIVIAYRNSSLG